MTTNSQCCYAVFEGLLPAPHNNAVLKLIFHLAHWHGIAKLRLHSDLSLDLLDTETTHLGEQLRHFKDKVCPVFETRELKREVDSRKQRAAKQQSSTPTTTAQGPESAAIEPEPIVPEVGSSRKRKTAKQKSSTSMATAQGLDSTIQPEPAIPEAGELGAASNERAWKAFSLDTYKAHSLGDYVEAIKRYGTTDSFSTETVSGFILYSQVIVYLW